MARGLQAAISLIGAFLLANLKDATHPGGVVVGAEVAPQSTDRNNYPPGTEASRRESQHKARLSDSTLREAPLLDGLRPVDYEDEEALVERIYGHGHGSQKGSGEKYGKLLSKGNDFTHLPETHPARIHADSKAFHKRSFHLILAGIVLATAYLGFYCYQASGSGLRSHEERHNFALSRMGSPSSALLWVLAWRLWLGLLVSGLVSIALNAYRLEKAFTRKKEIVPRWVVEHWEILLGLPLLALILLSGKATQMAALDAGSAPASAGGLLGKVLANSGAAYRLFVLDAFFQIPFGLFIVGFLSLLGAIVGKLRQRYRKTTGKKQISQSSRPMSSDGDETPRPTSESALDVESRDPTESRSYESIKKKLRKERSSRRRRKPLLEELPEQEELVRSHSSTSTRKIVRRRRTASKQLSSFSSSSPITAEATVPEPGTDGEPVPDLDGVGNEQTSREGLHWTEKNEKIHSKEGLAD